MLVLWLVGLVFRAAFTAEEHGEDYQGYDESAAAYTGADAYFCCDREASVR